MQYGQDAASFFLKAFYNTISNSISIDLLVTIQKLAQKTTRKTIPAKLIPVKAAPETILTVIV